MSRWIYVAVRSKGFRAFLSQTETHAYKGNTFERESSNEPEPRAFTRTQYYTRARESALIATRTHHSEQSPGCMPHNEIKLARCRAEIRFCSNGNLLAFVEPQRLLFFAKSGKIAASRNWRERCERKRGAIRQARAWPRESLALRQAWHSRAKYHGQVHARSGLRKRISESPRCRKKYRGATRIASSRQIQHAYAFKRGIVVRAGNQSVLEERWRMQCFGLEIWFLWDLPLLFTKAGKINESTGWHRM